MKFSSRHRIPLPEKFKRSRPCVGGFLLVPILITAVVATVAPAQEKPVTINKLPGRMITLTGPTEVHVTGGADALAGGAVNFLSPDAWLFLNRIPPSTAARFLSRFRVNGTPATLNGNVRVVPCGPGTVIIPQKPDFAALTVFDGQSLAGTSLPLKCGVEYDDARLGPMKNAIRSLRLERGYMATIAQNQDGTGASRNYVAQDHDVEISTLPPELDRHVGFIRVFPWRWTSKKGMAGDIGEKFDVGWFYNWNLNKKSTLDVEYVPIRQNRWWPGLDRQDWTERGANTLLGYNEPDHKDQSNLTVDEALAGWPDLLATGLRLGSPAVSDGGLGWLYEFLRKADAAGLRVDFVAVHYYRSYSNPADPEGAARQFYNFLKGVHDRVQRPIWVTEWNNGANWTKDPDPTPAQQKATIAAMVRMLDETPFVERYAIYNWVEDVRFIQKKNGSLTGAGEAYRDEVSPVSFVQPEYEGSKRGESPK